MADILKILKDHWGYGSFRPGQREIIESVLGGHDTLGLLPTGAGKSVTFQVPGLALGGVTLVITPLIALMKDQVDNLRARGIKAAFMHSGMARSEVGGVWQAVATGHCSFLYVAPERLLGPRFADEVRMLRSIKLLVVDEAHCISQWGHDFRPAYMGIASLRKVLPPTVPVLALTASATPQVREDIRASLRFGKGGNTYCTSFARPNISYVVRHNVERITHIVHILRHVPGSSIVYVRNRRRTLEIAEALLSYGITAAHFHAGLDYGAKEERIEAWKAGRIRVMVATNAFGMGIDKPDVRTVIHYDMPPSLEEYYQEAGRAGRDGGRSYAVMLTSDTHIWAMKRRITETFPDRKAVKRVYGRVCDFLGIALGEGYDRTYAFDIDKFCATFGMQHRRVEHSLALLGAAGYMTYIQERDSSSRVFITCTREELYSVGNVGGEHGEAVLRSMLRLCPGIFAGFVHVNENRVAAEAGCTPGQVYEVITGLRRHKVLEYVPRSATPLIYMNTSREETGYVQIPISVYEERRDCMRERLEAVLRFAADDGRCRAVKMLEYLGQEDAAPCGTCDTCRERGRKPRTLSGRRGLRERVYAMCGGLGPGCGVSAAEVMEMYHPHGREAMDLIGFMVERGELEVVYDKEKGKMFCPVNNEDKR